MQAPKLLIRKGMLLIQGKVRPCCYVQAIVGPEAQALLEEHCLAETMFKRAAYSMSWPRGAIECPPAISPSLSQFLKNDACPEISVKTLLAGQMHQGANVWEMMCFEFVAKLAFNNFVAMVQSMSEIGQDVIYRGQYAGTDAGDGAGQDAGDGALASGAVAIDADAFAADTADEMIALAATDLAA